MQFKIPYASRSKNSFGLGQKGTSLQDFFQCFPNEEACLRHVFETRFGPNPACPNCGVGITWKALGGRQFVHWKCKTFISPFADTAMARSRVPTQTWFYLMLHLANSRESISTHFAARHLGISLHAAHRMLTRIRLHLAALDHRVAIGGPSKEVYVRIEQFRGLWVPQSRRNRAYVLLIEGGGFLDTVVLDRARPHRFRALLMRRLHQGSRITTNCAYSADLIRFYGKFKSPEICVQPSQSENSQLASSSANTFSNMFRRGIRIQHQTISPKNFWLVLKEYQYRHNRLHVPDQIFSDMVSQFPICDEKTASELKSIYCDLV